MSHPMSEPMPSSAATSATTESRTGLASAPTGLRAGSELLAEFSDYAGAQALVDRLSDDGFPVEHVRIIGTGIHSVEQVTGRLTIGRAALAGAASGAWFGLFVGLLFGLFTIGFGWLYVVLVSLLFGVAFGAVFGAIAHWATRGARDFSSVKAMAADTYSVYVDAAHATQARGILGRR